MELYESLMQAVEAPVPEAPEKWRVDTPQKAEYATWKIAKARANMADKKAQLDAYIAQATAWYESETKEDQSTIDFFTGALQPYILEQLTANKSKKKSMALINGAKASFKKVQPEYQYDEAALMEWAKENAPEYITTPAPKLAWGELKKALTISDDVVVFTETGEKLDLITAVQHDDAFAVDTKGVQV